MHEEVETAFIDESNMGVQRCKKTKNHQNMEKRLSQNHTESLALEASEYIMPTSVFEVDVEVNHVEEQNCISQDENGLENTHEQQQSSLKKRQKQNCAADVDQAKANLVSAPSEVSIISAAAVEELHHLRSYYSKQLRRINYISHEHLQSSQTGMLTCMKEPFKSLHFPSRTTLAKGARNLWTRVSMRRKLIQ